MRTIRCFIDCLLSPELELALPEHISNHIIRVLRLEVGDTIHLFNGDGNDYPAKITSLEKRGAKVRVLSCASISNESPLRIHLYQSIARGEKMDWILQKATELGVTAFTPMVSDRTEVKLDQERSHKRLMHWQGVIRSACEQSGRASIPVVHSPCAINRLDHPGILNQAFYLHPGASLRASELQAFEHPDVNLAIGPEGGFSERDIQLLQNAGFIGLTVGPRILRTETAGIALIAALQCKYGDW
jgi:16S rRNA (uracil1498-N3)-methyltransferase